MYQLILTFEDAQMMADTIADILNNHREVKVSISLDAMISPDHPEYVPTAADRRFVPTDFSTEKPDHMVRADARARFQKAKLDRIRRDKGERATFAVPCPKCHAPSGTACVGPTGKHLGGYTHMARIISFERNDEAL